MDSETNPAEVLFVESQRLGAFADFWRRRVEIEEVYLDNLSGLRIPDPPGNGQLQGLAHKTRELLMDELEERRRGLAKFKAAYKALTDEFLTEEGPSHFDRWGRAMNFSLLRISTLAAEITTAESNTERLAVEAREKENPPMPSSAKQEHQSRSNVLYRFLDRTKNAQPETHYDLSPFLSADSAYRQKVQQINDEKYTIQNGVVPQTVNYVEHDRKCIIALKHVVSAFSAMHSDLAQVLNVTSSQLCILSPSVDASVESASFAERLGDSFTSLVQPQRYTSYEISSSLRPTTMLFGCPLPDELDGTSIGQRAVAQAFKAILSSAADKHPRTLYEAICNAHKQQGNDVKLSALQLESLWDPSQVNGGLGAVDYLAKAPVDSLLVYFLTRLPEPFLPLHDSYIKRLAKVDGIDSIPVIRIFAEASNRMGTARRFDLARLFLALQGDRRDVRRFILTHPEGAQILTRTTEFLPYSRLASHIYVAVFSPLSCFVSNVVVAFKASLNAPQGN